VWREQARVDFTTSINEERLEGRSVERRFVAIGIGRAGDGGGADSEARAESQGTRSRSVQQGSTAR